MIPHLESCKDVTTHGTSDCDNTHLSLSRIHTMRNVFDILVGTDTSNNWGDACVSQWTMCQFTLFPWRHVRKAASIVCKGVCGHLVMKSNGQGWDHHLLKIKSWTEYVNLLRKASLIAQLVERKTINPEVVGWFPTWRVVRMSLHMAHPTVITLIWV